MSEVEFSTQDAQNLVALAENAPLRNLKEAEQVSKLLTRFVAWHAKVTAPVPADVPEAKTRKPRSKPDQTPPADAGAGSKDAEDLTK